MVVNHLVNGMILQVSTLSPTFLCFVRKESVTSCLTFKQHKEAPEIEVSSDAVLDLLWWFLQLNHHLG